jgi:hypothetical protein
MIWSSTELVGYLEFPYAAQVFRLNRHRIDLNAKKEQSEVVYGITSLTPEKADPARLLSLNRYQWGIENKLHYVRDVTFDEDRSRVRKKAGPHVMASLRNLVISVHRLAGAENIAKALRSCSWNRNRAFRLIGIALV